MPTSKNKKTFEKSVPKQLDTLPERPLTKIKFNISTDNLRPFVEGGDSARTIRKKPKYNEVQAIRKRKTSKTEQSKDEILAAHHTFKRAGSSPDVACEVSNQILRKIETNGIRVRWEEVEEVKAECCDEDNWSTRAVWQECSPRLMMPFAQSHRKNQSYEPLLAPMPIYYQDQYQYHLLNYEKMSQLAFDYFNICAESIGNDQRTTLMIKNIPNKYTIQFLAEEIDKEHANTYDFLYLPCDIKNNCNVGYGFVNFLNTDVLKKFYVKFHSKRWGKFKSEKICNLTYARLQGLESLIEHFQNSKVLNHKDKKYQPIIREFSKIDHLIKEQKSKSYRQA